MRMLSLTPTDARRLAITRQRLAGSPPTPSPDGIMDILRDIRCLQLDPIRAVERTQYLALWSRLGNYDLAHLDTLLWDERKLFEYWAHCASIVLTEDYPLYRLQMENFEQGQSKWGSRVREWLEANEAFKRHILTRLEQEGSLSPNQIEDHSVKPWNSTGWTNEKNVTRMLSFLWERGEITVAGRKGLHKRWALIDHHLPDWTPREALSEKEIVRQAIQLSLRALGVGTAKQIKNHFTRNQYPNLEAILAELVAEQRIIPIAIDNEAWPGQWYLHADDVSPLDSLRENWQPRTTLLSPFDNLICDRDRTELMWDFYFRIEIYVPKAKRQYGYYVLPLLHGDRLIGRIDPKMDRKTGLLHVNAIYVEAETPQDETTGRAVAQTIETLAQFLGAKDIAYQTDNIPLSWQGIFS